MVSRRLRSPPMQIIRLAPSAGPAPWYTLTGSSLCHCVTHRGPHGDCHFPEHIGGSLRLLRGCAGRDYLRPERGRSAEPGGNMDSWVGLTWGFENTPIPNGKTVAYPFTANAGAGGEGIMTFSNNMPDLTSSHYYWKRWFSETPGGAVLNNNSPYCRRFSPNPNPQEMRWTQSADPNRSQCNLDRPRECCTSIWKWHVTRNCRATFPRTKRTVLSVHRFPVSAGSDEYYIKVYPR